MRVKEDIICTAIKLTDEVRKKLRGDFIGQMAEQGMKSNSPISITKKLGYFEVSGDFIEDESLKNVDINNLKKSQSSKNEKSGKK